MQDLRAKGEAEGAANEEKALLGQQNAALMEKIQTVEKLKDALVQEADALNTRMGKTARYLAETTFTFIGLMKPTNDATNGTPSKNHVLFAISYAAHTCVKRLTMDIMLYMRSGL